ncbi:lipoyl synthase, partial [mine drainage metagenome]
SWGLRYVVLTQVCRDDLPDQGAGHLAATIQAIHRAAPGTRVELLAGDLGETGKRSGRSFWRDRRSSPTTWRRSAG